MTTRPLALLLASLVTAPALLTAQGTFTVEQYANVERVSSPLISPDGNHVVFSRARVDALTDSWTPMLWEMDADGSYQRELVHGTSAQWSPDGSRIGYLAPAGGRTQLWVRYLDDGGVIQVTHGVESPVDFRWSPDGRVLAFTMAVADTTAEWKIAMPAAPDGAHWGSAPQLVTSSGIRADGSESHAGGWRQLFVVAAEGGAPRQVTHGQFDVGAGPVAGSQSAPIDWLADGTSVVFDGNTADHADRVFHVSHLQVVDIASGTIRRLTSDSGFWHGPVVSPDGKWIAYTGRAAGGGYHTEDVHIVHPDGSMDHVVTNGLDRDPVSVQWSDNETLWFTADDHGTRNTWMVSISAKVVAAKPASNGTQIVSLGSIAIKAGIGVATRSDPRHPAEVVRFTVKKPFDLQPLTHVNDALLTTLRLGDVDQLDIASSGDTRVQGWLMTPPTFTPQGKYPLLLEIHGGPQSSFGAGFNPSFQNFAAAGFLVLYLNPRGSTGYGSGFGNATDKAWPGVDYDDLMAGVDAVIARGVVDTTRMYVDGEGGGGTLAAWIIGHSTRFAAAAVRDPVVNWISFAGETQGSIRVADQFARPFWDDPAPWLARSPIQYAGRVTTPTLIITGDLHRRPLMAQSEELYAALTARGIATTLVRVADELDPTGSTPSNWMRAQLYITSWYNRWKK
jgi:dipeptidyl aminopeptidase/acylaminoacyl peptidase